MHNGLHPTLAPTLAVVQSDTHKLPQHHRDSLWRLGQWQKLIGQALLAVTVTGVHEAIDR